MEAEVGCGDSALKYLSAYVYRTALGSQRILKEDHGQITFKYKSSEDQQWHTLTLPAMEFIRRFLQHVLPQGFRRVRYYGWLSAAADSKWERILALLDWKVPEPAAATGSQLLCSDCGQPLHWLATLSRAPP